jgi:DNA repair protein RadC
MKTYKTNLPEITLKLKKGNVLKAKLRTSKEAANIFRQIWDVDSLGIFESVIVIFLNRNNNTIGWYKVSQGGLTSSIIDNRLILVTALNCLATGIIMCHNHPSGNLQPSDSDINMTLKLRNAAEIFDINIVDHIILTEESHYSMADNDNI